MQEQENKPDIKWVGSSEYGIYEHYFGIDFVLQMQISAGKECASLGGLAGHLGNTKSGYNLHNLHTIVHSSGYSWLHLLPTNLKFGTR